MDHRPYKPYLRDRPVSPVAEPPLSCPSFHQPYQVTPHIASRLVLLPHCDKWQDCAWRSSSFICFSLTSRILSQQFRCLSTHLSTVTCRRFPQIQNLTAKQSFYGHVIVGFHLAVFAYFNFRLSLKSHGNDFRSFRSLFFKCSSKAGAPFQLIFVIEVPVLSPVHFIVPAFHYGRQGVQLISERVNTHAWGIALSRHKLLQTALQEVRPGLYPVLQFQIEGYVKVSVPLFRP